MSNRAIKGPNNQVPHTWHISTHTTQMSSKPNVSNLTFCTGKCNMSEIIQRVACSHQDFRMAPWI